MRSEEPGGELTNATPQPADSHDPQHPPAGVKPEQGRPVVEKITYVSFSAEISQKTTESLLAVCADLANKGVDTVYLMMSTPGGRVDNGMTLYNVLRAMPFKLVTHNVGAVNSIGNVVFLAGEERYTVPNATFMFHGVGFDTDRPTRFEERLLLERLDSIQADQRKIAAVIEERANFPDDKEIAALFLQAATKDPAYALERGIVHDVRDIQIPRGAPVVQLVFQR